MAKCRVNWGALPEGTAVSVYNVINTAFSDLYVIAKDEKSAMEIAWSANHVRGTQEIHEDHYFRAAHKIDLTQDKTLQQFSPAIHAAIARRLHGTLHLDNGQVFVGYEMIKS